MMQKTKKYICWLMWMLPLFAIAQQERESRTVSDIDALSLSLVQPAPQLSSSAYQNWNPQHKASIEHASQLNLSFSQREVSKWFIPTYARENPANWAPLCHLEADIEKQLPIGIWVNWEESKMGDDQLRKSANLRLRLLRF